MDKWVWIKLTEQMNSWQSRTWRSVSIQQVVVLCGVEVHDDAGAIEQLLIAAGAGDAVVAVPAVASVKQLLRLHLDVWHPENNNNTHTHLKLG